MTQDHLPELLKQMTMVANYLRDITTDIINSLPTPQSETVAAHSPTTPTIHCDIAAPGNEQAAYRVFKDGETRIFTTRDDAVEWASKTPHPTRQHLEKTLASKNAHITELNTELAVYRGDSITLKEKLQKAIADLNIAINNDRESRSNATRLLKENDMLRQEVKKLRDETVLLRKIFKERDDAITQGKLKEGDVGHYQGRN